MTHRIRPPTRLSSRALKLHKAAVGPAKTSPEFLANPEVARAIEHALVEAMVSCLTGSNEIGQKRMDHRREMIMRRLEEVLQANSDRSLYIGELCAAAEVSYPTLRAFCWESLGMNPKRYLLLRRMHLARRALRQADLKTTTVTEIATSYGFWELGRFAGAYRLLFGETPIKTLRRPAEDKRTNKNAGPLWEIINSA